VASVTRLAAHSPLAVHAALAARGWDAERSRFAAAGLESLVVVVDGVGEAEREALVHWSVRAGADVLTGEGWALVAATASRLAPLARPDRAPPGLEALVPAFAEFLRRHADPPRRWVLAEGEIPLEAPVLVGVLNVTPDSFSDGGRFSDAPRALDQAERLRADGAQLLDVGGESTRPGAPPVPASEEIARVVPVVTDLVRRGLGPVCVDTRKADVARAAIAAGAVAINDVSGLRHDARLGAVVAAARAGLVLMHMRGEPGTMDALARYDHVAGEVAGELRDALARAAAAGIGEERLVLDPGFGFAKTAEQNWRLLDELATVVALGYPVLVGPSRKRFLGAVTGRPVDERDRATAVACALAWERGARLFRVHDVALAREALALARALEGTP
jgi:dihydropteroate synthase